MEVRKSILEAVKALCIIHGKELTEELIMVWSIPLGRLTDQEVAQGLKRILTERNNGFMPVPAEFIEYATTAVGCATIEDEAELAWHELDRTIRRIGSYQSVYFKNSIIAEWVRLQGGWSTVCSWQEQEIPWKRKEFISEYTSLRKQNQAFHHLVEGTLDSQNRKLIQMGNVPMSIKFIGEFSQQEKEDITTEVIKPQSKESRHEVNQQY